MAALLVELGNTGVTLMLDIAEVLTLDVAAKFTEAPFDRTKPARENPCTGAAVTVTLDT